MTDMASRAGQESGRLADVVTLEKPLGPPESEALVGLGDDVFRELYDETNTMHASARKDNPFYVVGRKGAGKTAFLIGAAIAEDADVILIKSENIYMEVNRLAARYCKENGVVVAADNLVHVWEVLLFHVGMLQIVRSNRLLNSHARQRIWAYMSTFGDPEAIKIDTLLAAVNAEMTDSLLGAPQRMSFRDACWAITSERGDFVDAAGKAREVLAEVGPAALYVVVDNLEDLHRKLDNYADVITALFRVASRSIISPPDERLPFRTRFAFPAELLPRLRLLAANPEKDFQKRLTIRWSARELIIITGNRLRTFLDVHFPDAPERLGLAPSHDPSDANAARQTLRAVLPKEVTNALGGVEDPIAYLMRHTQLLPRHLIIILNEIMSSAAVGLSSSDIPRPTGEQVVAGVLEAELTIVDGILTTYSYSYPEIANALEMIKNQVRLVESTATIHKLYNQAGVRRSGLSFHEFLDACLSVGVLGVVRPGHDERYVTGFFSYTFAKGVKPVEDKDQVCVHPLFVPYLFDKYKIDTMKKHLAVYPYGSDPKHLLHEV